MACNKKDWNGLGAGAHGSHVVFICLLRAGTTMEFYMDDVGYRGCYGFYDILLHLALYFMKSHS